jgi:hypothetical protein
MPKHLPQPDGREHMRHQQQRVLLLSGRACLLYHQCLQEEFLRDLLSGCCLLMNKSKRCATLLQWKQC